MNINFIQYINPLPDYDPLHPPRTKTANRFSHDPVHPGAIAIIEKLRGAETEGEVRGIVWESFRDLFMNGACDADYRDAVYDVWKFHCR